MTAHTYRSSKPTEEGRAIPSEWRRVPISPYRSYEVSSDGRVRRGGRELSGQTDRYGYRTVQLSYAGLSKRFKVHRLVCEAFNGPCPAGSECAHLNGDRACNLASNLAWVTPSANNRHKELHGTAQFGERHPRAKLSQKQVDEIRASECSTRAIAREFGVGQSQVVRIRTGQRWVEPQDASQAEPPATIAGDLA